MKPGRAGRNKISAGLDGTVEHLPKVIRYAGEHSRKLLTPNRGWPFAGDDYNKKTAISIICLPLKYNDILPVWSILKAGKQLL